MSKRIKVIRRQATLDDVDAIFELDQNVWDEIGNPATRDMFVSRIETFPEGNIVATINEKVVGYMCHQLIDYDLQSEKFSKNGNSSRFNHTNGILFRFYTG